MNMGSETLESYMVLDGIFYALALTLAGTGLALWLGAGWAVLAWLLAGFMLYFFRDPERRIPPGEGIVSPADGRVVDLRQVEMDGLPCWKISIFLNIFDVHVNRAPVGGIIRKQVYSRGKFLIASRPEASVENEQNTVTIEAERDTVVFKQIAGLVARRIVFTKKVGDRVERGERVGLIKFGSRVDLFLPTGFTPQVVVGDRVQGGSSWVARPAVAPPGIPAGHIDLEPVAAKRSGIGTLD
jgi:phosphatidylserine decarboxylase